MSDATTYRCPFCRSESSGAQTSCPTCGAPVDIQLRTTTSGWTELPPVADMAKVQLGHSRCQIAGRYVPVAEVTLAEGDSVYFPHSSLLWQEPSVALTAMPLTKAWDRMRAGLPIVMLQATGPGKIAFSHDTAGELLAVPLQPGTAVDVREHRLVAATGAVGYDWVESGIWFTTSGKGGSDSSAAGSLLKMGLDLAGMATDDDAGSRDDEIEWHYPLGRYIDRFVAPSGPGAVLVQVGGNAFLRELAPGESILVKPPALLFKDPTVSMQLHIEYPHAGMKFWRSWGNRYLWLRVTGPGRVALQSSYERLEDPGKDFRDSCAFSQQAW
ncbi:MAG TPA: AIM24 family protein [Acidimicrobiales bacterium]|nr:AIM24 family protein [Acidimicrobiales bacterium]